jgi:hypothetical protein
MRILCIPLLLAAACATSPATRSPLRERLAASGNAEVESAVKACLKNEGWKVDELGSYHGGANVVTAYKAKEHTDVYIYPPEQKPRITGGPDAGNPFWKCVATELAGGGAGDKDTDKDKTDDDKAADADKKKEPDKDKAPEKKGAP